MNPPGGRDEVEQFARTCGIGLADDDVRLVPHDPRWRELFSLIRAQVQPAVSLAHVEHIGSTAVPGALAKPLIDVSVVLHQSQALDVDAAEARGLVFRAVNPDAEATLFALYLQSGARMANVHVRFRGTAAGRWDVLWRDYLRAHPGVVNAYGEAKREAQANSGGRLQYSAAKTPFIAGFAERADQWAAATGWVDPAGVHGTSR